jgi:hypothetical protein
MARWRKNESLSRALAREGRGIAKGVGKGLLSIRQAQTVQTEAAVGQGREETAIRHEDAQQCAVQSESTRWGDGRRRLLYARL